MFAGIGYDVHRFEEGYPVILGGVTIPFEKGLVSHSDGDALTHAIMDALLGACGMGDIGIHFPDNDEKYKGVSSISLLKEVRRLMAEKGFAPVNVDAIVIAQAPRISPHSELMKVNIAEALALSPARVNIKATTTEKLGFEGRGEGISAQAIAFVEQIPRGSDS